ncbi:uncharacterized protein LY89DRAFT_705192 [Mollisia scopiformis]|uniref:Uncharacterized protein n=1 Tax=Mollisia scopiformis TaxID=149040 RepID=A0A194XP15_MOLSC|nr:uncharacterized protein LY89DRAFT_705192 [Mollisia scopiformis]KUJ21477.1 hypothetical protein LY89DRAFT_705192 [Mollisia scopiformis]
MPDTKTSDQKNAGKEISDLAEQHIQHDLTQSDRDALKSASGTFSTYTTIGSLLGLGLGAAMAFRVRKVRTDYFKAFRAIEKPTHVQFANGRTEALPDLTPMLKPSTAGDIATYFFFSAGGLFVGGETGLLLGGYSAKRTITGDPERKARVESAFRKFKADVLKRQIAQLEKEDNKESTLEKWF